MSVTSHEDYIAAARPEVRPLLLSIQALVETRVPDALRCISYAMPAFRLDGRSFFYFAAFKKHIGVYPPVQADAALGAELAPYRNARGNLAFPLSQALPLELIGRVAEALAREYGWRQQHVRKTLNLA